jgi:hypothetical protein
MDGFNARVVAVKVGQYRMPDPCGVGYIEGRPVEVTVSDGVETVTITGRQLVGARGTDPVYSRLHREAEAMLRRNRLGREIDTGTGAAIGTAGA